MGIVIVASFFNYSIKYASTNKTGQFRVRGFLDPSYFTKKLVMIDGYLEWKAEEVPAFTFSQDFFFELAVPNVTEKEKNIILKMVNNMAGNRRVKDQALIEINTKFGPFLTDMLNHENLIGNNNFTYKYGDYSINFNNYAKDFELSNDDTKGLEVHLLFGIEHATENCTVLPKNFDEKQYGGLQELYTFSQVRAIFKEALYMGLYDRTVDESWEVPSFQFYMGDLGNFVPYANNAAANERFGVTCKFNRSRLDELRIMRYDEHQVYTSVPESCIVHYASKDILQLEMDINTIVYLRGEEQSINVVVESTGIFGLEWKALDTNYQVESEMIAQYVITEVLNGMVGKTTFGSSFPIIRRKYPAVRVLDEMVIVFDPSEY